MFLGLLAGISAGSWRPRFRMVGSYSSQGERSLRVARPCTSFATASTPIPHMCLLLLLRTILAACHLRMMRPSVPFARAVNPILKHVCCCCCCCCCCFAWLILRIFCRVQSTRDETIRAIRGSAPSFPEFMSPGLAAFISDALVKPAAQRSSLAALMAHPWILEHARWGFGSFWI